MAKQTAVAETRPIDKFRNQLKAAMPTVMRMLPAHVTPEAFQSRVIVAVSNNQKLLECSSDSLLKACAEAAELGLSLNPQLGEAWILPVWNGREKRLEAQLRTGYIGLMKLAKQSGEVKKIEAHVVYEGDDFHYTLGLEPALHHIPALTKRLNKTHVYCWWMLKDGERQFEVMDADQVNAIRERSSAKNKDGNVVGPWVSDEDEMWRKTVVRRSRKYMPQSAELFHRAVAMDNEREFTAPEMQGEYTDVTDAAPAPSAAARTQTEKLEEKLASGGRPYDPTGQAKIERLEPPEDFGGPDYGAWRAAALVIVGRLNAEQRAKWRALHKDILAAAEAAGPEFIDGLGAEA